MENLISLKAILVDDEENALKLLESKISVIHGIEVVGKAQSIAEAKKLILKTEFNILFLDIELSDGTGFNLLNELIEINFLIVFTTAYNEFAIEAFKVHAVYYLLKPIDNDELKKSILLCQERLLKDSSELYDGLSKMINQIGKNSKIALRERGKITFIEMDKIIYIKAESQYASIHTINGNFLSSSNMGYYEKIITHGFLRTHRSYLVNVKHLVELRPTDRTLIMSDHEEIPYSNNMRKNIEAVFGL